MRGLVSVAFGLLLCSACSTTVTHQRKPAQPITVTSSEERTQYLIAAYEEIQSILDDPAFAADIKKLDDYPLATSADSSCQTTKASDVLNDLRVRMPAYRLESRYSLFHLLSTAATRACESTAVNTRRIDSWEEADPKQRGSLINTLAHEMTHVLPTAGMMCAKGVEGAYTDAGHAPCSVDAPQCNDAFLVSYVWGDLLECAYRERHGVIQKGELHACFLGLVNSNSISRTTLVPTFGQPSDACRGIKKWSAELPASLEHADGAQAQP